MKYIKTFESYSVNETQDMMFMPVDPIKGTSDMYNDIYKSIKDSIVQPTIEWLNEKEEDILKSIKPSNESLKKIHDFMMKNFGTISPDLNSKNITKMIDVLGLEKTQIMVERKNTESIMVKILAKINDFLLAMFGFKLPTFVTGLLISGIGSIVTVLVVESGNTALNFIGALAVAWVLIKVLMKFHSNGTFKRNS